MLDCGQVMLVGIYFCPALQLLQLLVLTCFIPLQSCDVCGDFPSDLVNRPHFSSMPSPNHTHWNLDTTYRLSLFCLSLSLSLCVCVCVNYSQCWHHRLFLTREQLPLQFA
ncbi:hypothetical protein CSKR_202040 [Clonorchis sinensis]|uniref:Uncharacterized protein n=1 Tax=Clonorchis sinensis TaxID=79923 RepID=A0A8T1N3X0_CLOSI|nr:hypothetical protein CSKR_202040 [Clonorchis sinensis]